MESVLEVYQRRYHPDFPVLCLDEAMKQLVKETVEFNLLMTAGALLSLAAIVARCAGPAPR